MSSRTTPPLQVPDGLSVPDAHTVPRVPDIGTDAPRNIGGCLDRPPAMIAVPAVAPANRTPAAAPAETPEPVAHTVGPADATPADEIDAMVHAWARAWSSRDADTVATYYSPEFAPGDGSDRADWLAGRRDAVATTTADRVLLEAVEVTDMAGDTATVRFIQHFISGDSTSAAVKELEVRLEDGRWRITGETVIDVL